MPRVSTTTLVLVMAVIGVSVAGCVGDETVAEVDPMCRELNDQALERATESLWNENTLRHTAIPKLERAMARCPEYPQAHSNAMALLLQLHENDRARAIAEDWKDRTGDQELLTAYEYALDHIAEPDANP